MDSVCSKLHSEGVGALKKSAEIISYEDEECLWEKAVIGFDNPLALFNAVFFTSTSISAFEEAKNTGICQSSSFIATQKTLNCILKVLTMSILNSFKKTINISLKTFIQRIKSSKPILIPVPPSAL